MNKNVDVKKLQALVEKYGKADIINAVKALNEGENYWDLSEKERQDIINGIRKWFTSTYHQAFYNESYLGDIVNGDKHTIDNLIYQFSDSIYMPDIMIPSKLINWFREFIANEIMKLAEDLMTD